MFFAQFLDVGCIWQEHNVLTCLSFARIIAISGFCWYYPRLVYSNNFHAGITVSFFTVCGLSDF